MFVGLSFSVSLYLIGFAESFLSYWEFEVTKDNIRIVGSSILLAVTIITFISTLAFAPHLDRGILFGAGLSILVFLYKSMRPKVVDLSLDVDRTLHDAVASVDLHPTADIHAERSGFGHRGGNQPVKDLTTGHVEITSQNHGFAVREQGLPNDWKVWFKNANDGTVEGIRHMRKPFYGVQFHPEANPGPMDTAWIFDEFASQVKKGKS